MDKKFDNLDDFFAEKYTIQIPRALGIMYYYGISNLIKRDKDTALTYFRKAYQLSKEKDYNYDKRFNYLYIYKCRKYLFKNNKITLKKLNKTKEKLFRLYEECLINNLNEIELYNYYKLYKIGVYENTQTELLTILNKAKTDNNILYYFQRIVYREKSKIALKKENSKNSSVNENTIFFNKENSNDKVKSNIFYKTKDNSLFKLRIPKKILFIMSLNYLYTKYPELETRTISNYTCNGNNVCLFDTIQDNGIKEGDTILI